MDMILLNQLAMIKGIVNRKAFCITNIQIGMIHSKFFNMYDQRNEHNGGIIVNDFN